MHNRKLTAAMLLVLATPSVYAAGFALIEQSASGQGLSYAGAAANAEDASVMWFNPAGMTEVSGNQAILAGHLIVPKSEFSNEGSYTVTQFGNIPTSGNDDNGATNGFVPNLYWKGEYKGYDIGLGINVPFGQKIKYEDNWVGRYHAIETNLKTLNINPSIAKKINDKVSLGFGLNAQYVDLILSSKINNAFGSGTGDGDAEITADSWAYGYNLGLFYQPTPTTDLGLAYRSSITHFAKGEVEYTDVTIPGLDDEKVKSTVNLPASLSLSLNQGVNKKLKILADATWTQWSDYDELVIQFESGFSTETRQDFKDSWRLSLGGLYQLNDTIKLRAGVAFDQTPVSNPENRSPRTPDVDRKWISVGLGYKLSEALNVDVAYTHITEEKAKVNYTTNDAQYLVGSYSNAVDIFSAQIVWKY